MRKFLLSFLCLLTLFAAGATEFTPSSSDNMTADGITVSFAKGSNSQNVPAWTSSQLRLYAGNTVTISCPSNKIASISFSWSKQGSKTFASASTDVGTYSHPISTGTGTWTGSANTVVLTVGSSGQLVLNKLTVTLEGTSSGGGESGGDTGTGTGATITDEITLSDCTPIKSGYIGYDVTKSGAQYYVKTYYQNKNTYLQFNTTNGWLQSKTSGGKLKKISFTCASNSTTNRTVTLYKSTTAITSTDGSTTGLKSVGSVTNVKYNASNATFEITPSEDTEYFLLYFSGATYLTDVKVEWESGTDTPPAKTDVTLAFSPTEVTCEQGQAPSVPTLTVTPAAAESAVTYSSSNTSVATVDATGAITLGTATGSTTITASIPSDNATYNAASATYTLTVTASTPSTGLGDITASPVAGTYNNGTEITFSCANATAMELKINDADTDLPYVDGESIKYTLNHYNGDYYKIEVRAYDDELNEKTATFVYQIQAPGSVSVSPAAVGSDITIAEGSAITITAAANIDQITYSIDYLDDAITDVNGTFTVDANNTEFTLTPAGKGVLTLQPSLAGYAGAEVTYGIVFAEPSASVDATFDFTKPAELSPAVTPPSTTSSGTKINDKTFTSGQVTLSLAKNDATSECYLWKTNTGTELRVYKTNKNNGTGATITITSVSGYKITGISMAANAGAFSVSPGSFKIANKIGTWTAPAGDTPVTSVTFTCTTNAQVPSITVTYEPIAAATQVAQPTVTVASGASNETISGVNYYTNAITLNLSCTTAGVTYHYSTDDGANWTDVSGSSFQLNAPVATLKVKATKDGLEESPLATAGPFLFAPAKPVLSAEKDEATNSYNVTITSATVGATIMYSTYDSATWTKYTGVVNFTEYGETTVIAKAVKEGYTLTESQTDDVHFTLYNPADVMRFERVDNPAILKADDKVIIVALNYNKAMAPYESGKNNCSSVEIRKIDEDDYHAIELRPDQQEVEIFTLVSHTDGENNYWRFQPEYTTVEGFLYAPTATGTNNYMKVAKVETAGNKCNATLTAGENGAMNIVFSEATRNVIRYNDNNGSNLFSCYETTSTCTPVALYVLTSSKEQVARPTISRPEGIYNAGDITEGVTISCSTEGALIRYTTDGQDARLYGDAYEPGTVIPVEDCTTVRAYAYMADESMYPSASLIATYHVFTGNKVFTRVTTEDMPYLAVGDELIIVASDGTNHYAMGITQTTHDGDPCREAVALTTGPDANGNLTLTQNTVQPFMLLSGLDRTENYDWRLYASGTLDEGQPGSVFDGYLYSAGSNNSLETVRIDDPNSPDMPNADVKFHSLASSGIGNDYNGVTVEFGATSGQENFPNHLGLHKVGGDFHFNCYTLDQIAAEDSEVYHVSIFKAYSTTVTTVPAFSHVNVSELLDKGTPISLTTRDPNAVIYYTIDGSAPTTESAIYTQPIKLSGSCTIKAFAVSEGMAPSTVVEQTYRVRVTRVFELVTVDTPLEEGDEIIFVNAIPFNPNDPTDTNAANGRYYALTDTKLSGKDYYQAAELTPEETPEGKPQRVALTQIDGEYLPMDNNETSHDHVIVAKLELDGSGSEESAIRPWLLNYGGKYFYSTTGHQLNFVDLPENIEERAGINVGIDIVNGEDYYTVGAGKQKIYNKATAVFSGPNNTFTSMRFNHPTSTSDRSYIRFNAYAFAYDNEEDVQHANTYPVSIYRAIDRIEEPSVTIYPTDIAETKSTGVQTYETEGTAAGRRIFYNPVKIVISQNLHTSGTATLKYAWSKTEQNAPVSSEYTAVAGNRIVIELDGYNARINGGEPQDLSTFSNETEFMETVIRAMAELGAQNSPSLPRTIHFRTVAPGIEPGEVVDGNRPLDLVRPEFYTVGADIWYTTDGSLPVPGAANSTQVDKADGRVMATINVPVGTTVKVGAFRPGFEPDYTIYTENTYYPGARPMQLVELTQAGQTKLGTDAKYLTYRTASDFVKYTDAHYYTVDPVYNSEAATGISDIKLQQVSATDAEAVFANPAYFRWTADYYVFALNGNRFENAVTGLEDGWSISVQDSEGANIQAHKTVLNVTQDGETTSTDYYGAILQRKGSLGQNTVMSHLSYTADGVDINTASPAAVITPAMPRPYGLSYYYETVRDLPAGYVREDDFEFVTGSSIPGHEDAENTLVFPAEQYTLRHFNCVFEFTRPNVCKDIIDNYDIVYDVAVVTYSDIDDLQGYYGDPTRDTDAAHTYKFMVKDVHPNEDIYPSLFINKVYYVPNGDNEGYSLLEANYGDGDLYRQSIEAPNSVTSLAPSLNFEMGYYNNSNGTIDWTISSHTEVTNPQSEIDKGVVVDAPFMYHVEAYYPNAAAGDDDFYYSHDTLIEHDAETCTTGSSEMNENDPFYLLTVGKGYASKDNYPDIYVTPIYFFWRQPAPYVEEEGALEDYTQWFQTPGSVSTPAPQQERRRATGIHDEDTPLIIRGTVPGIFHVTTSGGAITGIEEVSVEPESDAIYYNLNGVRVEADHLGTGIYIRIKGTTATKVLVK